MTKNTRFSKQVDKPTEENSLQDKISYSCMAASYQENVLDKAYTVLVILSVEYISIWTEHLISLDAITWSSILNTIHKYRRGGKNKQMEMLECSHCKVIDDRN